MSRTPLLAPDALRDPEARRIYGEIERELGFGMVPNLFRAMAPNPGLLAANWALFRATVLQGRLPRVLKEMVGVVVSTVHDSAYARLVHLHSLSLQGVQAEALRVLASGAMEAEGLSAATVAVLRFAQHAARDPAGLAEADFDALGAAGLSAEEVLEVIGTVQAFTAVNAFTDMVDLEIDPI